MGTQTHLVGSLGTETAEESFRLATTLIGDSLTRIPDGEVGERWHWLAFQGARLAQSPGLSYIDIPPVTIAGFNFTPLYLDGSVAPEDLALGNLGYADAAIGSWSVFKKLQADGVIGANVRFQVSLPTPIAVTACFVVAEARPAVEVAYATALRHELDRILAVVPHEKLAVQFDCAVEFIYIEGLDAFGSGQSWFGDPVTGAASRVGALLDYLPETVEAGVHLCYGDVAERHFFEPVDATNLVQFANAVVRSTKRHITWVHLPVPITRDDDDYYRPLVSLALDKDTELFLGLVHREDGEAGILRRAAIANRYVSGFGISTECGIGRAPHEQRDQIFALHTMVV